jgi:hypothetical protein
MMSLDYDTLDAAPASLVEASQLAKYKLTPIYYPADFSVPVSHPGNNPWLYTFDLSATANTVDLKTYNLGNFFLALDGVPQNGKDYGYLAVEYDVELLDKNPVINTAVFASKTYDSGSPVSKKNRSNVDPADTMDVETTWLKATGSTSPANRLSIRFSDNVEVGSKARVVIFLKAPVYSNISDTTTMGFGNIYPSGEAEVIETDHTTITAKEGVISGWYNLDITVPESRLSDFVVYVQNSYFGYDEGSESDYDSHCIAYTYA